MKQHMLWSFKDHNNDKARIQEAILGFPSDFVITDSPKNIGTLRYNQIKIDEIGTKKFV